jgi:nucleoid DNA-binding protein
MRSGRISWLDRLGAQRRDRVLAAIDAHAGSARDIYDRLNLQQAVRFATFRRCLSKRRRDRAIRHEGKTLRTGKPIRIADVKAAAFRAVVELLDAGRFNASMLREARLLLREVARLSAAGEEGGRA